MVISSDTLSRLKVFE